MDCMSTSALEPQALVKSGRLVPLLRNADNVVLFSDSPGGLEHLFHGMHHFCSVFGLVISVTKL